MSETAITKSASVVKVDAALGLVFGYAIVSKQNGADYFDVQGDHIPEDSMLKAAADFMLNSRVSGEMHRRADGAVVFAFPLTTEIAKALDIATPRTGLLVAIRPSKAVFDKFASGEYKGFSIGGARIKDETVEKCEGYEDDEEEDEDDSLEGLDDEEVEKALAYVAKWDESQHPRHDAGSSQGGEFAPKDGGGGGGGDDESKRTPNGYKVGDWTKPYKQPPGWKPVQITRIEGEKVFTSDGEGMHYSHLRREPAPISAEEEQRRNMEWTYREQDRKDRESGRITPSGRLKEPSVGSIVRGTGPLTPRQQSQVVRATARAKGQLERTMAHSPENGDKIRTLRERLETYTHVLVTRGKPVR